MAKPPLHHICRIHGCYNKARVLAVCVEGSSLIRNSRPNYIEVCHQHFEKIKVRVLEHLALGRDPTSALATGHRWAEVPRGIDTIKGRFV